jgi:hypothetical protein
MLKEEGDRNCDEGLPSPISVDVDIARAMSSRPLRVTDNRRWGRVRWVRRRGDDAVRPCPWPIIKKRARGAPKRGRYQSRLPVGRSRIPNQRQHWLLRESELDVGVGVKQKVLQMTRSCARSAVMKARGWRLAALATSLSVGWLDYSDQPLHILYTVVSSRFEGLNSTNIIPSRSRKRSSVPDLRWTEVRRLTAISSSVLRISHACHCLSR